MTRAKLLRRAVAALAAVSLGACVSVTSPVGTTVGFANDPALEGLWFGKADKDKPDTYIHAIANDDDTITVIGVTPRHGTDKAAWGVLSVTTAVLGGHRYMNLREISQDGEDKTADPQAGSTPLLYAVSGDTLSLYMLDDTKVAAAIGAHRIDGTVQKAALGETVAITADGAHLDALLSGADAPDLFEPALTLHRMKPPGQ